MSAAPIIEAEGLTRHFGGLVAVDGVNLSVNQGEIFGFLGPNGSGKTTTIRMLTGLLRPTAGRAVVLGATMPDGRDGVTARLGVVTDRPSFYDRLTARQNLNLFARMHGAPKSRVDELLALFGLADRANSAVKTFSLGMRQKLLLARAFIGRPELLFLDEPTRGLDPRSAGALRSLIRQENERGCTLFLTTHYMEEADQLCDRVALIAGGRIVATGTPEALKRAHSEPFIDFEWRAEPDGPIVRERLPLGEAETADRVAMGLRQGELLKLRRHEPTLEEVFLALTGERLEGAEL